MNTPTNKNIKDVTDSEKDWEDFWFEDSIGLGYIENFTDWTPQDDEQLEQTDRK